MFKLVSCASYGVPVYAQLLLVVIASIQGEMATCQAVTVNIIETELKLLPRNMVSSVTSNYKCTH